MMTEKEINKDVVDVFTFILSNGEDYDYAFQEAQTRSWDDDTRNDVLQVLMNADDLETAAKILIKAYSE